MILLVLVGTGAVWDCVLFVSAVAVSRHPCCLELCYVLLVVVLCRRTCCLDASRVPVSCCIPSSPTLFGHVLPE